MAIVKEFYNIDCMKYMKTLPDNSIEMVLTDIPYNLDSLLSVSSERDEGGKIKYRKKENKHLTDTSINKNTTFDDIDFLNECLRICKGTICIFCSLEQQCKYYTYIENYKSKNGGTSRAMVWEKQNAMPNNKNQCYVLNIEHIFLYKKKNATFNPTKTNYSCVLHYPIENTAERIHPTEKNHNLLKQLIIDNTNKGDIVFDPCMGSGSTCLVALQCGRQTIGCEIDKDIYTDALNRLHNRGNYQFDLMEDFNNEINN